MFSSRSPCASRLNFFLAIVVDAFTRVKEEMEANVVENSCIYDLYRAQGGRTDGLWPRRRTHIGIDIA